MLRAEYKMEVFNEATWNEFIRKGYRFLLYYNMDNFAIIRPLYEPCEVNENAYIIPIHDDQAREMASGTDDFECFVML